MPHPVPPSGAPPPGAPPLATLGARVLARGIAAGQVSARDLASSLLARIDLLNPLHNAVVSLRPHGDILAEAEAADRAVAAGAPVGPLHGLPIAVKDLAATKGLRTTQGSPLFADVLPEADDLHVARMRAAGAIVIGKTNAPEFGLGSHTFNPVFGPTRNALDPALSAGGSSGGAAVALALGMVPLADGSDFGGSLRNPAAWNNVLGLRPSQGRVPDGAAADAFLSQLATNGPMARHVEDLALLLSVQAGADPHAPLCLPDAGYRFEDRVAEPRTGRIAWLGDLGGHLAMEDGVLALCRDGLDRLEALGCAVGAVVPAFDFERLWRAFIVLRQFSTAPKLLELYQDPGKRALLKPEAQWEVEGSMGLTAAAVHEAARVRTAWYDCVLNLFDRFDFLALPAAQVFAFPVEWRWPRSIAGRPMDSYHRWMEVAAPVTLSGCPALSLPVGFRPATRQAMGLQIVGRPRDDLSVLQLAHAYEHANPWIAAARR